MQYVPPWGGGRGKERTEVDIPSSKRINQRGGRGGRREEEEKGTAEIALGRCQMVPLLPVPDIYSEGRHTKYRETTMCFFSLLAHSSSSSSSSCFSLSNLQCGPNNFLSTPLSYGKSRRRSAPGSSRGPERDFEPLTCFVPRIFPLLY